MIFITSDTHGEIERFDRKYIKNIKKGDTLIILGDFGFIWKDEKTTQKNLKKISKMPFRVLFIDGVGENFEYIDSMPDAVWCGAKAKEIVKDKIYYIKRGEVLSLESCKILCFGGDDRFYEDMHFEHSIPSAQDFENCMQNLKNHNFNVDYILTHIPSGNIYRFIQQYSDCISDTMEFFNRLEKEVDYKKWYFGSIHKNKYITPKTQSIYTDIKLLGE